LGYQLARGQAGSGSGMAVLVPDGMAVLVPDGMALLARAAGGRKDVKKSTHSGQASTAKICPVK